MSGEGSFFIGGALVGRSGIVGMRLGFTGMWMRGGGL